MPTIYSQATPQTRAWFRRMDRTVLKHIGRFLAAKDVAEIQARAAENGSSVTGTLALLVMDGLYAHRRLDRLLEESKGERAASVTTTLPGSIAPPDS